MGAEVVAITSKEEKRQAALGLGADSVLISEDKDAMTAQDITLFYFGHHPLSL